MASIFISSTYSDLVECRELVHHALRQAGHQVIAMEDYVATDERPLDRCLRDVASCDVYVGIVAHRYGFVPAHGNPKARSITELEYKHADRSGVPRLLFVLSEDAVWPVSQTDAHRREGANGEHIRRFRERVGADRAVSFFSNPQGLATLVSVAVSKQLGGASSGGQRPTDDGSSEGDDHRPGANPQRDDWRAWPKTAASFLRRQWKQIAVVGGILALALVIAFVMLPRRNADPLALAPNETLDECTAPTSGFSRVWAGSDRQCIGISDGSYEFNPDLAVELGKIHEENQEVIDGEHEHITVVWFGPMSRRNAESQGAPASTISGVAGELRGVVLAQRLHNDNHELKLRVLVANGAERFVDAQQVAEEIGNLAQEDPSVVAVIGLGHSQLETQLAVRELDNARLPMLSSINTYDNTAELDGRRFQRFYRVAPPNRAQADTATGYARQLDDHDEELDLRTAAVLYEEGDQYSSNLAGDFADSFGVSDWQAGGYDPKDPDSLKDRVHEACLDDPDLYYYAGRAAEFESFLDFLKRTACASESVNVFAGDDIAKQVADDVETIQRQTWRNLYFTALAHRLMWFSDPPPVGRRGSAGCIPGDRRHSWT